MNHYTNIIIYSKTLNKRFEYRSRIPNISFKADENTIDEYYTEVEKTATKAKQEKKQCNDTFAYLENKYKTTLKEKIDIITKLKEQEAYLENRIQTYSSEQKHLENNTKDLSNNITQALTKLKFAKKATKTLYNNKIEKTILLTNLYDTKLQEFINSLKSTIIATNNMFNKKVNEINDSPQKFLVERIINPIILAKQGAKSKLPQLITINSNNNSLTEKLFEWLIQKSENNYAILDISEFKNEQQLLKALRIVSNKAKIKKFSNYSWSFSYLKNFDNLFFNNNNIQAEIDFLDKLQKICIPFFNIPIIETNRIMISQNLRKLNNNVIVDFNNEYQKEIQSLFDYILNNISKTINLNTKNLWNKTLK